jgi:hypothetical protein
MANMSLSDSYPSWRLAMLLSGMPRRVKRHRREHEAFMNGIVREHQENRAAAADNDDKYHEDLLDVLDLAPRRPAVPHVHRQHQGHH